VVVEFPLINARCADGVLLEVARCCPYTGSGTSSALELFLLSLLELLAGGVGVLDAEREDVVCGLLLLVLLSRRVSIMGKRSFMRLEGRSESVGLRGFDGAESVLSSVPSTGLLSDTPMEVSSPSMICACSRRWFLLLEEYWSLIVNSACARASSSATSLVNQAFQSRLERAEWTGGRKIGFDRFGDEAKGYILIGWLVTTTAAVPILLFPICTSDASLSLVSREYRLGETTSRRAFGTPARFLPVEP